MEQFPSYSPCAGTALLSRTVSQLLHDSGWLVLRMAVSVNDMLAVAELAVTSMERLEVIAKDAAREVWILLDQAGLNRTKKGRNPCFFRIFQPS
ncbi:hypothetical protein [Stenotrophomonas forensis]|uniref:hypothetical protein n=1 Tax=Stenotrophomonas forensis TaxID=2871169 RepID=UPI0039C6C543